MYRIILGFSISLLILGCNSDDTNMPGCGFDNPSQDLAWLKMRIDEMESNPTEFTKYCYVVQANYKNRTVFRIEDCNPVISKVIFTLNCDGNRIDSDDDLIFWKDLNNRKVIWKPVDFACQVDF